MGRQIIKRRSSDSVEGLQGHGKSRLGRPKAADGPFLRVVTTNDVYQLDNYPRFASAIKEFKNSTVTDDAVVVSCLPGDFLSPCTVTNLDGGVAMLKALNVVDVDYVMFGNHEFDLKPPQLQKRIQEYKGTWINSNVTSPKFVDKQGDPLPEYKVIEVGDRKVALAAFLLDDMSQFAPLDSRPQILPPADSILATWKNIKAKEGDVHAFLPMLHLNVKEDRQIAACIAKESEIASRTPVLLCAHDHEVHIEEAGKSLIFKVGQDAVNIGVVDLYWTAEGCLRRNVHLFSADDFDADAVTQDFVDKEFEKMNSLLAVPITDIPDSGQRLSTARVRFEMEYMVSFLLSKVKASMPNVDIVLLQGGNVRGGTAKYKPGGQFSYGDLMKELAFETNMAIIRLPGQIIRESIRNSRMGDGARPFFLHCDLEAEFDHSNGQVNLEKICGVALDENVSYTVGIYQFLLAGMGNIEPLSQYCKDNTICPPLESCLPIKKYFMQTCMRKSWLSIFESVLCREEPATDAQFQELLNLSFSELDRNKDGLLDASELKAASEKACVSNKLVNFLIQTFDADEDGKISREDLEAAVHH